MLWLTEDAELHCGHAGLGRVTSYAPLQSWVTVGRRRVLVQPDPEGRPMKGCEKLLSPATGMLPCSTTLPVTTGYSTWVRIGGHAVCLSSVVGLTVANPQTNYRVFDAGQPLVEADG